MLGAKGFPIQRPWSLFMRKSGASPERCLVLVATYTGDLPFNPITSTGHRSDMNYAAAVAAVSIFLAALNWYFFFRKHYTVPRALYIEGFSGTYLE